MSVERDIRQKLNGLGFKRKKTDIIGIEVSVCQFIIVILSLISVVFLFLPLFFLKNPLVFFGFFAVGFMCLCFGLWFWLKKSEICEHPEEYDS